MKEKTLDIDRKLSKYMKALCHPVRLAIIRALMEKCSCPHGCDPCCCGDKCEGENCKCGCKCGHLVDQFSISQSTVSQHIKELKSAGLINHSNRKGDYSINHSRLQDFMMLLNTFLGNQSDINKPFKLCN